MWLHCYAAERMYRTAGHYRLIAAVIGIVRNHIAFVLRLTLWRLIMSFLSKSWVTRVFPATLKPAGRAYLVGAKKRSEEHTSELQSRGHLVCRLLLEKKKPENR